MKKHLIFCLFMVLGIALFGQYASTPEEHLIGTTYYDLQSHALLGNRFYRYDNGHMAAVWIQGFDYYSFTDRRSGYAYYNGTEWTAQPTVESQRAGWPSYSPIGAEGEIVFSHNYPSCLLYNTRETVGAGDWTEETYVGITGPPSLAWPRAVVGGEDMMGVHLLANSYDPYMGMEEAVLYSYSPDGGNSWEIENVFLDGMGPDHYFEIGADEYVWAYPRDSIIAFLIAGTWHDMFVMKSTDYGENWEKIMIWNHPYPFFDWNVTYADTFYCVDNSAAIAIDPLGKCHVVFGINRTGHTPGSISPPYFWYVGGIGYWNENMPPFSNHLDALAPPQEGMANSEMIEDYNYIAWLLDINDDGEITLMDDTYHYKQFGPCTMPSISIDEQGRIFVIYSSLTETYDNGYYNFRHIWLRSFENGFWGEFYDLTGDIIHLWEESIYPTLAQSSDEYIHYIYQSDITPGLAIDNDHPFQENRIIYGRISKLDIISGIGEVETSNGNLSVAQNFPNPCRYSTSIMIELNKAACINIDIVNVCGQKVKSISSGYLSSGVHYLKLDVTDIHAGSYFYTVSDGKHSATKSLIIE